MAYVYYHSGMETVCVHCGAGLRGRQTKYCSIDCKNTVLNDALQAYPRQRDRGITRKLAAIKDAGGGCVRCGYSSNMAALVFHHRDPSTKVFGLTQRALSNMKEARLAVEIEKCDLLCQNCHHELHNPNLILK